ncbi:hypothetical protein [Rhodanobacter sp. L36]|uniref:hypothetical protein n=1 Tax=Rhodanobacter sp. L36 TaxID=1747221 RepID=UPI00131BFBC5|nr:hypothetical protein [Rhodanobacter sp. L36]
MPNGSLSMSHVMRLVILVTVAAMLCSCLFDSDCSWHSGRFEIGWIDVVESSQLTYQDDSGGSISIVGPCVFAAGANDQFVVVKQDRLLIRPSSTFTL